jgi:hypothetical protein
MRDIHQTWKTHSRSAEGKQMVRPIHFFVATALTAALSAPASAQTTSGPAAIGETRSHWIASGFAGSSFGTSTDGVVDVGVDDDDLNIVDNDGDSGLDFGGQVAYLWKGLYGAEVIVNFAPSMAVGSTLLFADEPSVNSYMANAMWAIPLGVQGKYQPFLSAGLGAIRVSADMFDVLGDSMAGTISATQTMFGGNIGGGILAFAGHVGLRGDVRFYKASKEETNPLQNSFDTIGEAALSGLSFWRGNFGLAFRW